MGKTTNQKLRYARHWNSLKEPLQMNIHLWCGKDACIYSSSDEYITYHDVV